MGEIITYGLGAFVIGIGLVALWAVVLFLRNLKPLGWAIVVGIALIGYLIA